MSPRVPACEAVVLSAGRSSRAGAFKPALDCGGVPLVVRVVRAFTGVCARVWVVTGHRGEEVAALVDAEPGVVAVANPRWDEGMFSSVRVGVARVSSPRFFITPGDLPELTPAVAGALLDAEGETVVPLWRGTPGHPVLLDAAWVPRILAADPHATLRAVLATRPRTEVEVATDVVSDIDTCQDYEDYLRRNPCPTL